MGWFDLVRPTELADSHVLRLDGVDPPFGVFFLLLAQVDLCLDLRL